MKRASLLLVLLFAAAILTSTPAAAAGGGADLPFNSTLTQIQDNLTGPTANTIVVLLIICGLITVGVSKETPWMKTFGGLIIIVALMAKAATLPGVLGLSSASATAYSPQFWPLAFSGTWCVLTFAAAYFPLDGEQRSPSRTSGETR